MSQYESKQEEHYEEGVEEQASELDQMHQEFKEFQRQQALKREREAREGGERPSHQEASMSSHGHYEPPQARNPNLSRVSQQMDEELNQSKGRQMAPSQETSLQKMFVKEPRSGSMNKESQEITDDYLFRKADGGRVPRDLDEQARPSDASSQMPGGKGQLSFGDHHTSQKQASIRGSNRDLAEPPLPDEERQSLRSGRRANDHEDSQNFGAMQSVDDRLRLEEFMRGDSTSISKANRTFGEDGMGENSVREFAAAQKPSSRAGSRAEIRASERSSRRSARGADAEPAVEIDRIVVEKSPRKERTSQRKQSQSGSRGRRSANDSKLYERAGSMSSIGKGSNAAKDVVPFVDEMLSNINDTRMSNALQPKRHQDNNQSISVLANVFDQIDPTNPKDNVKKINESMLEGHNESKLSTKQHGENSKENEYGSPSHGGNDTGNFALQNSNHSKSHNSRSSLVHNQSRGTRGSNTKQPDLFYEMQPRETFNPNDYDKLRINQSLDGQIKEEESPQPVLAQAVQSRFPTEEELRSMDKQDLDRLMEERMDQIMAQQRRVAPPARQPAESSSLRHQTPFFAHRNDDPVGHAAVQQPPQPPSHSHDQHVRQLSNSKKERPAAVVEDHIHNFSVGHQSRGGAPLEDPSLHSIGRQSLQVETPQPSAPEEHHTRQQLPASAPKEGSLSYPSLYSTEKQDKEQFGEEFRAWQQKKNEEMQLKKNEYFSRPLDAEAERVPSRRGPQTMPLPLEYDQRSQQRPNDSFSNNTQPVSEMAQYQAQSVSHQHYRPGASTVGHPPAAESRQPAMSSPRYAENYSQPDMQSQTHKMMPTLHPQKQVYAPQQQYEPYPEQRDHQPAGRVSSSGRVGSNTRREYQPVGKAGPSDPWGAQQPSRQESQGGHLDNTSRNSSLGSRMSRAGRTQKYADGRQSRSGSRGRHECEISSVSIIKSPRAQAQNDRDVSLDNKRRRMAEDMAKAQEAQRRLEEISRRKRQEEQRKLFQDIQSTNFGHQILPQSHRAHQVKSKRPNIDSDADDFGGDDEFNDIDEGTIKAGGPQMHRRTQDNQGALNQRNARPVARDTIEDDNLTLDTRKQLHRGNNRGVKILQISNIHEQRQASPINSHPKVVNSAHRPPIVNNAVHTYQPPMHFGTQPQMKQGGGRMESPFLNQNGGDEHSHRTSESRTQHILPVSRFDGNELARQQQAKNDLFNRVMRETDPKQALHQYVMRDKTSFDTFKDSMGELNNRIDRELSRLRAQNKVADRLIDQQRSRDRNLQKYQDHINQQRMDDEMKECTFTPQLYNVATPQGQLRVSSGTRGQPRVNSGTRQRSPAQFVSDGQAFQQRKQNWINEQNMKKEQEFQQMQQTKFVNDGSRKILKGRRPSNTSGADDPQRPPSTRGDSRASGASNDSRSHRSDALKEVLDRSGDRRFKFFNGGDRSKKVGSRAGSKASGQSGGSGTRGSRIVSLQGYSGVEKKSLHNSRSPSRAQQPPQITNATSDAYLIMQLHREYQDVIQHHIYERGTLHIEDILQEMGFIDERIVSNQQTRLGIMLRQQRNNLLLGDLSGGVLSKETDEIVQNLFKVLCSIMNLKSTNHVFKQIDQTLLNSYLGYIDLNKDDQDILILEQLATIKSLINRSPYSVHDTQVLQIHRKFMNLYNLRKNQLETNKKLAIEGRAADQNKGMFKPQIDSKSAQYKPQASIQDRSQEFHQIPDRDPRDIEFEQQQQHCTFKPMTNRSRPWQGNRPPSRAGSGARGGSGVRGPASLGRGERPNSRGSGTNNSSITRQRFGPTQPSMSIRRNDSGSRIHQMPTQVLPRASPTNAHPQNQYVAQPSKHQETEPPSDSESAFKKEYLSKNGGTETESSYSLNPKKFQEKQAKNTQIYGQQRTQPPQTPVTVYDPDTYIGARETQKDDLPFMGAQTPVTPSQQSQSHTKSMPRVRQIQQMSMNQSKQSSTQPNDPKYMSHIQQQRFEPDAQYLPAETQGTNSMLNDSFGPETPMDQAQVHSKPPQSDPNQSSSSQNPKKESSGSDADGMFQKYFVDDRSSKASHQSRAKSPRDKRVPICVLKIELDKQNTEEIRVHEGEDPNVIVNEFGGKFNLTENAMGRLHAQIIEQIKLNESRSSRRRSKGRK